MRILVIEDDPIWQSKICAYLEELGFTDITICEQLNFVLLSIDNVIPDIIISDIMLGNDNVFDVFDYHAPNIPILFITTSEEERLYKKSQLICNTQYLIKPFHKITLQASIDSLLRETKKKQELAKGRCIVVKGIGNEKINLRAEQIIYVISELNYCVIKTPRNQFAFKSSLEKIQITLGDDLIRVHKSYLVNKNYILRVELSQKSLETKLGSIPIGRLYKSNVLDYLASIRPI